MFCVKYATITRRLFRPRRSQPIPFCPFKNDRRLTWLASGFAMLDIPNNESEQVLSVQHGINCRREESQISEPGDATIREKAPNPFHLIRREAVSFANLKTFVPDSPFGRSLFGHAFSLQRLVSAP